MFAAYDVSTGKRLGIFNTNLDFKRYYPKARLGAQLSPTVDWQTPVAERLAREISVPRILAPVPGTDEVIALLGIAPHTFMLHFRLEASSPTRIVEIPASPDLARVSPDGRKLALGYRGGLVLIVDAFRGGVISELHGHRGNPTSMEFSADGQRLFSRAEDGTLRIWNVQTGELITTTYLFDGRGVAHNHPGGLFRRLGERREHAAAAPWPIVRRIGRPNLPGAVSSRSCP